MSKIALAGATTGTGTFTLASPATNTDRVLTLPDEAGTVLTSAGVPASAMPAGSVLQVVQTQLDGRLTTTNNGDPSDITKGVQVFSLSFTPSSASSMILVQTSSIAVSESANGSDMPWVALFDGSTFISAVSGSWAYYHLSGNQNAAHHTLNELYAAGSTATRTISVRAGMNSSSVTTYVNGNEMSNYTDAPRARIKMIVMEIAA